MSRTARSRGTTPADLLNFARVGSGPPLVLIHGLGHRWQAWEPVIDDLSAHHDVIALDLPGFGASPRSPGMPMDIPALAAAVSAFLAAQGIDRPHMAGVSLGGAIALELAAAGVAASVTAFSPAGFASAIERRRALAILRALRANTFLPAAVIRLVLRSRLLRAVCFGPLVAHPSRLSFQRMVDDALAMRRGRGFGRAARSLSRYQFVGRGSAEAPPRVSRDAKFVGRGSAEAPARVSRDAKFVGRGSAEAPPRVSRDAKFTGTPAVPVTVAWGDRDRILRPNQADHARARLPHARHVVLPDCGHVPMSDDPTLVVSTILATTGATRAP